MFDFEKARLTTEQIMQVAESEGISALKVAISANGSRYAQDFWSEIEDIELDNEQYTAMKTISRLGAAGKGFVGFRSAYEALRKIKPFEGRKYLANQLKEKTLPSLEGCGAVCLINDRIYVNPRILERDEFDKRFKVSHKRCAPWHEKYTKEEVEEAMEILRLMRKINKALK